MPDFYQRLLFASVGVVFAGFVLLASSLPSAPKGNSCNGDTECAQVWQRIAAEHKG